MTINSAPNTPIGRSVAEALQRLRRTDPWLRAFVEIRDNLALQDAGQIITRAAPLPGPLHGMPIAVKGTAGMTTGHGRRLRAAGAIPIGMTSTPRGNAHQTWGHTDRGPTRNPWRGDLSPGGSSAGSAAAVAAGIVELATGTDGAGSIRLPAAWCGIVGYKPTNGLIPTHDPTGLAVAGPLVRDPQLLPAWADAVLGTLPHTLPARTVAWSADLGFAQHELEPDVVAIARAAGEKLATSAGLEWSEPSVDLVDPASAWMTVRRPDADQDSRAAAARLRARNNTSLSSLFVDHDLLFTPTTPGRPHGHDGPGEAMSVALTWAFNLSGHPAMSVPAGFTSDGAPVGLQIVARHRADRGLLDLIAEHVPPAEPAPTPGA